MHLTAFALGFRYCPVFTGISSRGGVTVPGYCVNKNAQPGTGDHEVHDLSSQKGCLPNPENRLNHGTYASCGGAVEAAKRSYDDVNGCYYGANECHTT
jgi:hypothetical protein